MLIHCAVKFFKSPIWAEKLIKLGEQLVTRKDEIRFALSVHTAVGVDATRMTVEEINVKMDMLISIVNTQSKREQELEKMIGQLGARDIILDDLGKLDTAAEMIVKETEQDASSREPARGANSKEGAGKASDGKDGKVVDAKMRYALNTSLDTLLEDNARIYGLKLQEQTKQIQDALDASTQRILRRFDAGPHERILHPVRARRFPTYLSVHLT